MGAVLLAEPSHTHYHMSHLFIPVSTAEGLALGFRMMTLSSSLIHPTFSFLTNSSQPISPPVALCKIQRRSELMYARPRAFSASLRMSSTAQCNNALTYPSTLLRTLQ